MQVLVVVLTFVSLHNYCTSTGDQSLPEGFLYFPNLEAIKAFFRNDSNPESRKILETFEQDCMYMPDPGIPMGRRKPFIVIEGNHRTSRNVIGMKLSRRLNGRYLNNLAPCLHDHFYKLPQGSITRRVFYLLSIYATVFNAKVHMNLNRAVILNGYWWEQVTFSLLHALEGAPFPPLTSHVFQYPTDLMQPDLVIYIDQPEKASLEKQRSVAMYRWLSSKHPIMIQPMTVLLREAVDNIYQNIRENLSAHLDFRYKADPYYDYT